MSGNIMEKTERACSGCGACAAVCPKDAIKLELDKKGFYSAVLDTIKCVDCGICKKVCTRYSNSIAGMHLQDAKLYALQSKKSSVVRQCSSGGIAHELAVQALRENKKVVGVIYNSKTNRAEHIIATKDEELLKIDGSKYLQSNPERAFKEIINTAKNGKNDKYIVFGTPCQIAGLVKCCDLADVREKFLFVEIFCHGVPTYKLWDEECKKLEKRLGTKQFESVQFRYKKYDWHSYCLRVQANGKVFYAQRETDLFWQVFFENILLGDSCYQCSMRKEISAADIRIGDYWGQRFQQRKDGVSVVFACTARGKKAVSEILADGRLIQLKSGDVKEVLAAQNMEGYHQWNLHNEAMKILKAEDNLRKAVKEYRKHMPIKQKVKRIVLVMSSVFPNNVRTEIRKVHSNCMLKQK